MNKRWFAILLALIIPLLMAGYCAGPVVATITVTPSPATVAAGGTLAFTAVAMDSAGSPITTTFTWFSSDTAKATVDADTGLVTGVVVGNATITATAANGVTRTAPLSMTVAGGAVGVWNASSWDFSATWGS